MYKQKHLVDDLLRLIFFTQTWVSLQQSPFVETITKVCPSSLGGDINLTTQWEEHQDDIIRSPVSYGTRYVDDGHLCKIQSATAYSLSTAIHIAFVCQTCLPLPQDFQSFISLQHMLKIQYFIIWIGFGLLMRVSSNLSSLVQFRSI